MKSFQALIAAACIANVNAHMMMVCSATSCNTPGRVTVFLGSYHSNPNSGTASTPGGALTIKTLGGQEYDFTFSATCGMGTSLDGTSSFAEVVAGMKDPSMPNSCTSQGEVNPAAKGKNIIDEDSVITCYKNDGSHTDFGTQVAIEDIEHPFCRFDGGDHTQGNKVKKFYGFYYMVLDNVASGDYTFDGWTDEIILSTFNNKRRIVNDVDGSTRFVGVCGLIAATYANPQSLGDSTPQAISLSVAQGTCAAPRCQGAPSSSAFPGLDTSTVEKCNKEGGAVQGYMCNARCQPGFQQVGSMICDSEGNWNSFACVDESETSTAPCHIQLDGEDFKSIQYDAEQMCGYTSAHGAQCDFTCKNYVRVGGLLTCNNGVWEKDEANLPQCLDITDVPRAPVSKPCVEADQNAEGTYVVTWEAPSTCQGSDGAHTLCSPTHKFYFVVTDGSGGESALQCAALNSGIPMPVRCAFPQGQAIQDFAIGVVAVNGAGDSSIDSASMTKFGDNPTGCVSSFSASAGQAQSQMECVHEDCLKWSCEKWCECWDETLDYSSFGCYDDDEPCDCGHYAPPAPIKLVAPSRCTTWCVGGKACGDSCISKDFTCRDPETREGANNLGRACDTSMYIRPCPSMPNRITNTQCDNMVADAAATAETCEESCCESSCQTWLFKEGTGCYHSDHSCTVMWQGIGGASGWNGGSAFLIEM